MSNGLPPSYEMGLAAVRAGQHGQARQAFQTAAGDGVAE